MTEQSSVGKRPSVVGLGETTMTPKVRSQLRTAATVAESGKIPAAIKLYRELLETEDDLVPAWIGLGNLLKDEEERREAYQKALEIEPKNSEAIEKLAILDGKAPPEITLLKEAEKAKVEDNPAEAEQPTEKVEPNIGGVFSHPVDISEWVMPDGSMVDYKTGQPTNLRCNRCGRPISLKSSKSTSVGYRCFECIYEIEDGYYEATSSDYVVSSLVIASLSFVAGFLVSLIGGFGGFFLFFIAFAVGGGIGAAIARVAQQAIGRRRGRNLPNILAGIMAICIFLPALIFGGGWLISAIVAFSAASGARVQLR